VPFKMVFYLHIFSTVTFCGGGIEGMGIGWFNLSPKMRHEENLVSDHMTLFFWVMSNNFSLFRLLAPRVESSYFLFLAFELPKRSYRNIMIFT
jgi:hypothetical protein